MRWLPTAITAAAAAYFALENVRLRRAGGEARAAATGEAPRPVTRSGDACPPCPACTRSPSTGLPVPAPAWPAAASPDPGALREPALALLHASRREAEDHLAAFARDARLRPEQVRRAHQIAADIGAMMRARLSLDPSKAGEAMSDLETLVREADDRFAAMLDEDQRVAYERAAFDFGREAALLDPDGALGDLIDRAIRSGPAPAPR